MKDNLHFNAQERLKAGIDKIAKAVGSTMGTGGSNVVIETIETPGFLTTNDGYSIANSIILTDPIEQMGRSMLLESINRANKASGDGSSTTCVLTAAIINEGLAQKGDTHPMEVKRSLENCLPVIEESLAVQTRPLITDGELDLTLLEQVATVSAEDEGIGKMIAEIYSQIGPKGIVQWDISKTAKDYYTLGAGITVEGATYISPYMCDATEAGQNTNQIRLKNPQILLTKQKLTSAADISEIAAQLNAKEIKDLVIFADEVEPLLISDLILTRAAKGFRVIVIKMPVLWKDWWFEDLAKATGATVIDPVAGLYLKDLTLAQLGTVGNMVVTKEDTELDGIADVSAHIASLEAEGDDDSLLRASRLNTKSARYYVGAQSDAALSYRRLKVEDAIAAAYQALNGGIVAGGGIALLNATALLPDTVGGIVLRQALYAPLKAIHANSGLDCLAVGLGGTMGLNTKTGVVEDMFEAGIIDPAPVVLNAVKNAVSVAAIVLTAPNVVTLPRQEDVQPIHPNLIQR